MNHLLNDINFMNLDEHEPWRELDYSNDAVFAYAFSEAAIVDSQALKVETLLSPTSVTLRHMELQQGFCSLRKTKYL